jgi:L-rhamnose mutarotase
MPEPYVLLLDLKDDPDLIERYKAWHRPGSVPPEVLASIREAGITAMDIYLLGDRLVMTLAVDETFSPERKAAADAQNPAVQAWETLMSEFQKPIPGGAPGEKWRPASRIFSLGEH